MENSIGLQTFYRIFEFEKYKSLTLLKFYTSGLSYFP